MRYIVLEVLHMYKTFGETIASLRRAHGMRQQALAEAMAEAGMPVSNQAVSKWENDATLPNAQQFLTLCRVLDVDDITGTFSGGDAGGLLAGLNAEGRRRALEYIALLRESKRFAAAPEVPALRSLPLYSLAVSAGTGQFLDGESYEMQPVGPEVPEEANFGVRVAGDSMEPRFHDGKPSGYTSSRRSHPARSECFSTTAAPISNSSGATEGAFGCHSLNPAYHDLEISGRLSPARARKSRVLTKSRKLPAELRFRREFSYHTSFQCSSRSPSSVTVCTTAAAPAASSSPGSA